MIRGEAVEAPRSGTRRAGRWLTLVAVALLGLSLALALWGPGHFRGWLYHRAWYPTLAALTGGLVWREGRWPLPGREASRSREPAPPGGGEASAPEEEGSSSARGARWGFLLSLFLWSVPFWYFFELANFRLQNWFYVSAVRDPGLRWLGTGLAFATVLPALYLGYRWARSLGLGEAWRRPTFEVRPWHRRLLTACGLLFLALALWRSDAFFPLVWGALTLLAEPWNHRRDPSSSLLGQLSRGRYAGLVQLLAGGLFIGVLWEAYNYPAGGKWIYTVPRMEAVKWFEMPPPGFLGFPVLALDGYVVYRWLVHLGVAVPGWRVDGAEGSEGRLRPRRALAAGVLALVFSLGVQWGIDRWTVESLAPRLEELPLQGATVGDLRRAGVRGVDELARRDSAGLAGGGGLSPAEAGAAVRSARLAVLRGLGSSNAALLWSAGIHSICGLAGSDPGKVARAVRRSRPGAVYRTTARVRVWVREAAERCDRESPGADAGAPGPDGSEANPGEGRP